jgi:PAS domain S-box-containing protein
MLAKLSVLLVEDSEVDAELNVRHLIRAGYEVDSFRVDTADDFRKALASRKWDLILSDYLMPCFDVKSALTIFHEHGGDIPFIVISGAIGEEKAVELIKGGAHDYLLKDNMTRFPSVIQRELREARMRQELDAVNAALKISEERYRTMINASPDGIFITDSRGIITEVSESGVRMYGSGNKNELLGTHFFRLVPPDQRLTVRKILEDTMRCGLSQNVELVVRKKDHKLIDTEISTTLLHDKSVDSELFMIIIRDISIRKNLEMQLIHSERLAGLGEIASGIAHEINQPLNTISMAMDNLLSELVPDDQGQKKYLDKKLDKIFQNITRIRNIIDHIRVFSRNQDDFISTQFNLNSSILDAVSMISAQFRHHGIVLNLDLSEDIPPINGNTYKFEQVILNLLANSKDALLEKEIQSGQFFEKSISVKTMIRDSGITIEFADNGVGIPREHIDLIMRPFFTTKPPGLGTGLGLSISYQIIKEMHGTIEFSSEPGIGTRIIINLHQPL